MVLPEWFSQVRAWDALEDCGFQASRRGGRPPLRLEPFPTAGNLEPTVGNGLQQSITAISPNREVAEDGHGHDAHDDHHQETLGQHAG